ncbi:MAG TPA: hypothetical protein VJ955_05360, partial [Desulfuromonadales bacterium]|nr:hypothetical protein [Desulfuromonadales bacterium]
IRIFSHYRSFDRSRLIAMKWDGFTLSEAWHTWPQDGYMADFCVADANNDGHRDVAMAVVFDSGGLFGSGLFGSARSAVYLYKLP